MSLSRGRGGTITPLFDTNAILPGFTYFNTHTMRKQYTSQGTKYWVKQGAHVEETEAQLDILEAASEAYSGTDQKLVVTSGDEGYRGDGVHSWGSHHYPENTPKGRGGWALDLRIWGLDNPQKTADEIASILGVDFDVVYGPSHGTHIHVEYDP